MKSLRTFLLANDGFLFGGLRVVPVGLWLLAGGIIAAWGAPTTYPASTLPLLLAPLVIVAEFVLHRHYRTRWGGPSKAATNPLDASALVVLAVVAIALVPPDHVTAIAAINAALGLLLLLFGRRYHRILGSFLVLAGGIAALVPTTEPIVLTLFLLGLGALISGILEHVEYAGQQDASATTTFGR